VDANGNVTFTAAKLGTETFDYALKGKAEKGSTKKDVYVHKATVTVKVDNESIDVSGTKIWKDDNNQDGKRPVNIIVKLFADGTKVDSKTVTGSGDSWEFKFTDLPKYNAESQEIAYKEIVPLKDWISFCLKHLRPKGSFSIIHRIEAVPEILSILSKKLGGIILVPIWPKQGAQPKRVIIQGILGSKKPFRLHPGIILHNADNSRTETAESIMRQGIKIDL